MLLFKLFDCISLLTTDDTLHQWMMQFAVHRPPSKRKDNLSDLADRGVYEAMKIIESDGWKEERKNEKDAFYSKNTPEFGNVFKYEGIIDSDAESINRKLFYDAEKSPEWNNNVVKVNVVQTIDNQTNVVHFISKSRPCISCRDFVLLRKWKKIGDVIVHCTFSINHPEAPPDSSFVRGEQRFCTYVMRPLKNDPSKTHLVWLLHANLKGWLPRRVTDPAVFYGMVNHLTDVRAPRKS